MLAGHVAWQADAPGRRRVPVKSKSGNVVAEWSTLNESTPCALVQAAVTWDGSPLRVQLPVKLSKRAAPSRSMLLDAVHGAPVVPAERLKVLGRFVVTFVTSQPEEPL